MDAARRLLHSRSLGFLLTLAFALPATAQHARAAPAPPPPSTPQPPASSATNAGAFAAVVPPAPANTSGNGSGGGPTAGTTCPGVVSSSSSGGGADGGEVATLAGRFAPVLAFNDKAQGYPTTAQDYYAAGKDRRA